MGYELTIEQDECDRVRGRARRGGGLMQFAETVAVNRAFPLRVLPSVEAAEIWLRDEILRNRQVAP